MRPVLTLAVCSLILVGCGIPKPNTDLCVVNVPASHLTCHNIHDDYDDQGNIIAGRPAKIKPLTGLADLNKYTVTDLDGWTNLKAYLKKLREAQANCGP